MGGGSPQCGREALGTSEVCCALTWRPRGHNASVSGEMGGGEEMGGEGQSHGAAVWAMLSPRDLGKLRFSAFVLVFTSC